MSFLNSHSEPLPLFCEIFSAHCLNNTNWLLSLVLNLLSILFNNLLLYKCMPLRYVIICSNGCTKLIMPMFIPIMGHLAHLVQAWHCDWVYPRAQTVFKSGAYFSLLRKWYTCQFILLLSKWPHKAQYRSPDVSTFPASFQDFRQWTWRKGGNGKGNGPTLRDTWIELSGQRGQISNKNFKASDFFFSWNFPYINLYFIQ